MRSVASALVSTTALSIAMIAAASPAFGQASTSPPPSSNTSETNPSQETTPPVQPETGLQDIIVTAQRRSERLQNVPISVTAVTAATLAASGVTTTQDLSLVTPGLSIPQAAGSTQPHIRGIGSSANGPGLEPPVATYIDGVYIAAAPAALLTLNNVDRIEVLKGPQGTLFGRNATGGLIQVITKDPSQKPTMALNLSYGNYKDITADAYVAGGLTSMLSADLAIRYEHQGDGWGRNLTTGNETGDLPHDFAARSKWLFAPSEDTTFRLSLDYESRETRRDTQHIDNQYPATFNNAFFGGPFPQGRTYDINSDIDPENRLEAGGTSLQINQNLSEAVALQSITAYRETKYEIFFDLDLIPRPFIAADTFARDKQFSQELQLSSRGTGKLNWVAGVFYYDASDRAAPGHLILGAASPLTGAPVPIDVYVRDNQKTKSVAGYAQATYEILPATHLTLGGRYTYEQRKFQGVTGQYAAGMLIATSPSPAPGTPSTRNFNNFSYRIALDHKFGPDILGYVSYNTGFKSGGYNTFLPSNAPFSPEKLKAAEVGVKSELLNRHLRVNAAGYYYDYSNLQVGRFIDGNEAIVNAAKARLYGADLDAELLLFKGFLLNGGFAYNHSKFTSFPNADFVVPVGNCTPPPGGICPGSAAGNRLPFAPETTFNLGANYSVNFNFGRVILNSNYYRTSRYFAAPDNVGYQPAYGLVNASVEWVDPEGRLSVKAWGKNLGKTVYTVSLIEANQGLVAGLGAPRTYGVTLGYRF